MISFVSVPENLKDIQQNKCLNLNIELQKQVIHLLST